MLARRFARDLLACPAATIDLTAILDGGILIAQLPPDVGHAVDANARNKIYFTVSPEDARHLAATPRRCSRLGLGRPARVPRQRPCPAPRRRVSSVCTNDGSGVVELTGPTARNTDAQLMQSTRKKTPRTSGVAMAMQAKRLLMGVVAVAVLAGCATGTSVSGSGGPGSTASPPTGAVTPAPAVPEFGEVTESREVSGFTGVELTSIGDLHIEQTGTEALTIEADADVLPQLTSNVSNGILELGVAPGTTIATSRRIVYRLTVATLDSIAVSGAGDATASDLRADRLTVEVSGAGEIILAGTVNSQAVTISGTGGYNGEDLRSTSAKVTIHAAGNAVLRVSDRLDATVSGVGSVEYIGDPQVTKDISGVGSVKQR